MAHAAFISYSKDDKETADAICKALEENAVSCWYAPRNVPIGADWDASIVEALAASRVMILVWSTHSDLSIQVKREVALALDKMKVTVIPFRIESIESSNLLYYLNSIQWFDASIPPPEANLKRLVEQVKVAIPIVGQLLVSPEEQLQRSQTPVGEPAAELAGTLATTAEAPQPELEQTRADEESRLLSEVEAIQKDQAEATEEAEAEAFRHAETRARLLAEAQALQHVATETRPPAEAEALKEAEVDALNRAKAEAAQHSETKARLLADVESRQREAALKRAEAEAARKQS